MSNKAYDALTSAISKELEKDSAFYDKLEFWQAASDYIDENNPSLSLEQKAGLIAEIMQNKFGG